VGNIFSEANSYVGGLVGSILRDVYGSEYELILSNNWWSNNISKAIGNFQEEWEGGINDEIEDEVEGSFEKESLIDGFKTYSHKVYNTDPDWDFTEIWSNVYEGKGYPVRVFQNILAPNKPSASVASVRYVLLLLWFYLLLAVVLGILLMVLLRLVVLVCCILLLYRFLLR
jgi:hypothetical protein